MILLSWLCMHPWSPMWLCPKFVYTVKVAICGTEDNDKPSKLGILPLQTHQKKCSCSCKKSASRSMFESFKSLSIIWIWGTYLLFRYNNPYHVGSRSMISRKVFHMISLLVGGFKHFFHFIHGMSSFPLTFIVFKMVIAPPTRWRRWWWWWIYIMMIILLINIPYYSIKSG